MNETKDGSGAGWLLMTQALLGLVFYLALVVYPTSQTGALVLIFFVCVGMFYCAWRGLKGMWNWKK